MIDCKNLNNVEWNEVVDNGHIHFTKNYCKAFQEHGDGQLVLFYLQKNDTTAYQVMLKRKINTEIGEYCDFISPYGYGRWIIEGEYDSSIFDE